MNVTKPPPPRAGVRPAGAGAPVLDVRGLRKFYPIHRGLLGRLAGQVRAVDDVSFTIDRGETLSLVGESRLRQDHHLALHPARDHADRRAKSVSVPEAAPRSTSRGSPARHCGRCGGRCR